MVWIPALITGAVLKLAFAWQQGLTETVLLGLTAVIMQVGTGYYLGVYRNKWRVTSFDEVTATATAWAAAALTIGLVGLVTRQASLSELPNSAVIMGALIAAMGLALTRTVWRRFWERELRPADNARRTVVFGAGHGGDMIVKAMLSDPESEYVPVALIDDDPLLSHRVIQGVRVEGDRNKIAEVAKRHQAEVLLVAVTAAKADLIKALAAVTAEVGLDLRILPRPSQLVNDMTAADVRPPTVDDLLGRDPVTIDLQAVSGYIKGKRVLITGAGGSIGSELSRQIALFRPSELYLLDRDESALHGLQLSMEGRALLDTDRLVVADIRDRPRVQEVFQTFRPQVVFHTAALKHLTLLENHPVEGVKTNMLGTRNLIDAATEFNVERFVNISTDKAADPTSVLGATKLAAERITSKAAIETGRPYLSVRFGNVLGSRGSVLPTFLQQLEDGGPLTVTDPDATRFFMTIPEAVRLVVQAGAIGDAGEVLILDMGEPVRIYDLAQQLINLLRPGTEIEITGLRAGEKLHEILVATDEAGVARVHPRIIHAIANEANPFDALSVLSPATQSSAAHLYKSDAKL